MRILIISAVFLLLFTAVNEFAFAQSLPTIIEVEANPRGDDAGNEWVVLYNPSGNKIDVLGWQILSTHGSGSTYTIQEESILACEKIRITFQGQFIDNAEDSLILKDSQGNTVFQTPTISDTENNDKTWIGTEAACESSNPSPPGTGSEAGKVMTVVFVNLETKGESILVIMPNNKTMLIDGGMPSSYPNLKSSLERHGVSTVDVMMGTHGDQDHIAGLSMVLDDSEFDVKKVLISATPSDTATYRTFLNEIAENGLDAEIVSEGYMVELDASVKVTIVSPPQTQLPSQPHASSSNSNSLVTLMEFGNVSFLLTADATSVTEEWMLQSGRNIDIDIMNGPHHGSKYSSTDEFLDQTTPRLVVFSADIGNEYGHPHREATDRYVARGINYYQTGTSGEIVIKTDGSGCSLFLEGVDEMPCYAGIQKVPEFTPTVMVLAASVIAAVLAARRAFSSTHTRAAK